jgi:hypothetical protein
MSFEFAKVLIGGWSKSASFSPGQEIAVVFYVYRCSCVNLDSVCNRPKVRELNPNVIFLE